MKKRAVINLTLAVDLDMVRGPWDCSEDWIERIRRDLEVAAHYNPVLTVNGIQIGPADSVAVCVRPV
jgi:hypothetical protein